MTVRFPKKPLLHQSTAAVISRSGFWATASALFILATTLIAQSYFKTKPVYLENGFAAVPTSIKDWIGHDVPMLGQPFETELPDSELKRIYTDPDGNEIIAYIGYFARQTDTREVYGPQYDSLHLNSSPFPLSIPAFSETEIRNTLLNQNSAKLHAYFWYHIYGQITAERRDVKLQSTLKALIHRQNNAAIVVLATETRNRLAGVRSPLPPLDFVKEFIQALQPVFT